MDKDRLKDAVGPGRRFPFGLPRADNANYHLATALAWRETRGGAVTVATYDRELWRGARTAGLSPWPAAMP